LIEDLRAWFDATLPELSGKSDLAGAIRYAQARWVELCCYRDDGRLEIDSNRRARPALCRPGPQKLAVRRFRSQRSARRRHLLPDRDRPMPRAA